MTTSKKKTNVSVVIFFTCYKIFEIKNLNCCYFLKYNKIFEMMIKNLINILET